MSAICLMLIGLITPVGLMIPAVGNRVESIPRAMSFLLSKDGDITQSILLKNRGDEPVTLELTYKPFNIDVDGLRWIEAQDTVSLTVTLRVPEGTWAEVEEMSAEIRDRIKGRRKFPPMTMFSKLAFLVRNPSLAEADTVEIPLRLRYDFEREKIYNESPH